MPVARQPVFTPMPPIRKRACHTSMATHRLIPSYDPAPDRQGPFHSRTSPLPEQWPATSHVRTVSGPSPPTCVATNSIASPISAPSSTSQNGEAAAPPVPNMATVIDWNRSWTSSMMTKFIHAPRNGPRTHQGKRHVDHRMQVENTEQADNGAERRVPEQDAPTQHPTGLGHEKRQGYHSGEADSESGNFAGPDPQDQRWSGHACHDNAPLRVPYSVKQIERIRMPMGITSTIRNPGNRSQLN